MDRNGAQTPQDRPTRLLGIFCNWSPFACLNAAGQAHLDLPPEYAFMRVMCIGRINQALILRAFEYGADGVILLECKDEDCRYGPGPEVGHSNVDKVRRLLHLLGIGQSRLVERSFQAHEKEELAKALWDFSTHIEGLGPNPAKPPAEEVRQGLESPERPQPHAPQPRTPQEQAPQAPPHAPRGQAALQSRECA